MLTPEQIDEVRRIARLESLRSAVLSVASESLDSQTSRLVVVCALEGESLSASFQFQDSGGFPLSGASL